MIRIFFSLLNDNTVPAPPQGFHEEPLLKQQSVTTMVWEGNKDATVASGRLAVEVLKQCQGVLEIQGEEGEGGRPFLRWTRPVTQRQPDGADRVAQRVYGAPTPPRIVENW